MQSLREREAFGRRQSSDGQGYSSLNMRKMALQRALNSHGGCVNTVCWSDDGSLLATGSDDTKLVLWNAARNYKTKVIETSHMANVFSVRFLPETSNHVLASGSLDGLIQCTDTSGSHPRALCTLNHHRGAVKKVLPLPLDPSTFLSCGEDGIIASCDRRTRQATTLTEVQSRHDVPSEVHCISMPELKPWLVVAGEGEGNVYCFDRRRMPATVVPKSRRTGPLALNGGLYWELSGNHNLGEMVTGVAFVYDGNEVLASFSGGHTYAFDLRRESTAWRDQIASTLHHLPYAGYRTVSYHTEDPSTYAARLQADVLASVPAEARGELREALETQNDRALLNLAGRYMAEPIYRLLDTIPWKESSGSDSGSTEEGEGEDDDDSIPSYMDDLMGSGSEEYDEDEDRDWDEDRGMDEEDEDSGLSLMDDEEVGHVLRNALREMEENGELFPEEDSDHDPSFAEEEDLDRYASSTPPGFYDELEELAGRDEETGAEREEDELEYRDEEEQEEEVDEDPSYSESSYDGDSDPMADYLMDLEDEEEENPWDLFNPSDGEPDHDDDGFDDPWSDWDDEWGETEDEDEFDPFLPNGEGPEDDYSTRERLAEEAVREAAEAERLARDPATSSLPLVEAALQEAHALEMATNLCVTLNKPARHEPFTRAAFHRRQALETAALEPAAARRMRLAVSRVSAWLQAPAERAILERKVLPLCGAGAGTGDATPAAEEAANGNRGGEAGPSAHQKAPGSAKAPSPVRQGPGAVDDNDRHLDEFEVKTFTNTVCDPHFHQEDCSGCFARWSVLGAFSGGDAYPSSRFRQAFIGACNVHTVKDCCLLGPRHEFVAAGSDNGLLMVWDRRSGRLLNALRADFRVVNGVQGHPHQPLLASYGIDRTVKLWSPIAEAPRPVSALVKATMDVHQRCLLGEHASLY